MAPKPETGSGGHTHDMYAALLRGELSGTDALAASQQMLQILMDSMANAVFWKDVDSCYLGCNKVFSSFAGVDPDVLLGKSDRDMPWADSEEFDSDWFIDWDHSVIESGEPRFGILEQLRGSDGEDHWLLTNKVPLRDLDGEIIGILGTFEDVTEQRHTEAELQRTLDELDERVQQRTMDLMRANESLRREVEDRVRLQAQERQQRAYAETLRDTAAAMATTFDLDEVEEHVLVGVQRLVSHDLAAIVLVDDSGRLELSKCHAVFGYEVPESETRTGLGSLSIVGRLAAAPGPAIIEDPDSALGPASSVLGSRMRVGDQLVGYLFVESSTRGFYSEGHGDRLRALADQAGPAILNSRLATRVSELAAAEERQRLARELHDAVNQTLWTAALTAEAVLSDLATDSELHERVDRLRLLTRGALAEMRALLLELRPSELARVGLGEIIEQLITGLECRRTLDVSVDLEDVDLDPETHLAFYRIAQESLGNIAQHSRATALRVQLTAGPPVRLVIVDDGVGFDPDDVPAGHLGLTIMRERADGVGAGLDVTTTPGAGTTIELSERRR
jgi:PAS domain S-box-containing protein